MSSLVVMRVGWDSSPEAVQGHSTCLMLYSPDLSKTEHSQQENAIWRSGGDGEACGVFSDLQALRVFWCSVYWFPRFYCRWGIIFLLFKGAWGEILSKA